MTHVIYWHGCACHGVHHVAQDATSMHSFTPRREQMQAIRCDWVDADQGSHPPRLPGQADPGPGSRRKWVPSKAGEVTLVQSLPHLSWKKSLIPVVVSEKGSHRGGHKQGSAVCVKCNKEPCICMFLQDVCIKCGCDPCICGLDEPYGIGSHVGEVLDSAPKTREDSPVRECVRASHCSEEQKTTRPLRRGFGCES